MSNRLSTERSPYLLQHAENPVDWRPWGPEVFEEAKRTDKPVLLSIGYSTCHWCHVMAHESFEDETVAQAVNAAFLPVKVDREERPDVDAVYMAACLAMNEDKIPAGKYCVATSNRNFEGRQGPEARTMLAGPLVAAAAAVTGRRDRPARFDETR